MQFLLQHKYNGKTPINERALLTGSSGLMRDCLTFLFQCVDPRVEFGRDKFASEVFALFKRLGYSPQKLKSALQNAGNMNWPVIIAAMSWLVESIKHTQYVSAQRDADFEVAEFSDRFVTRLALNAYPTWMASSEEVEVKGQSAVAREMSIANDAIRAEVDRKAARLESLRADVAALQAVQSRLPDLDRAKVDCHGQIRELKEAVEDASRKAEDIRGKLMTRRARLKDVHERGAELKKQRQVLDARVAAQEMTPLEVQHLGRQRGLHEETLSTLVQERSSSEAKVKDKEREVCSAIGDTVKLAHDVKKAAVDLLMIPATAANAGNVDYRVEIDPNSSDAAEIVNVDLEAMREALQALAAKMNSDFRAVLTARQDKLTAVDRLESDKTALELRLERERAKLRRMEEGFESDKQRFRAESEAITSKVAAVERTIEELKQRKAQCVSESAAKVEVMQQALEDQKLAHALERNALNDRLSELADRLANHFTRVNDLCQFAVQRAEDVARSIDDQ